MFMLTTGYAQSSVLVLCSAITPGRAQGNTWTLGTEPWSVAY